MEVTPMGTYRPCCLYNESIPNLNVRDGHTIADAQHSDYMKELRKQFLDGNKPPSCNACWQEESVPGRMSKRKATFIKINRNIEYNETNVKPIFLDLKLGNICNLKCRICGSWSSSKWAQEEIDLADGNNELAVRQLKQGQWPRRISSWWQALDDALPFIEYLEFTGGEPFLINEHFDLLEVLVEKGYASKIDIHYNTNGTIWPARGEKLWPYFKKVEIAFSIDDVGKRFEYQRYGALWNETEEVIRKAVASKFLLQVCTTFNIQNAYYWAETEDWILKQGIRDIHFNILQEPPMFNLRNMPWDIKSIFELQMKRAKNPRIKEVIQFMALNGDNMLPSLRERLDKSDKYRKQSFAETHPEVWDLINDR
jgi:MoaA/NifB/PqqE/SkfB family radical SAM enzyme